MQEMLLKPKKQESLAVGLKLNKKTDADILLAVGGPETRQTELKRYMRMGLKELNRRREKKKKLMNKE